MRPVKAIAWGLIALAMGLVKALAWKFKIGWERQHSTPWFHSFSHLYRNKKTGETRWYHEPC